MRRLSFIFMVVLVLFFVSCVVESQEIPGRIEKISEIVEKEMESLGVPGVSIAVIINYEIEWAKGFGVTDISNRANKVTERTLFQAASISKPVAAMAALKLVEDGKLNLDNNINDYLKSWKLPDNVFTNEKHVSLKHLLSHTGGLTVHGFRGYKQSEDQPTVIQILNGESPSNSDKIRVSMEPGKKYRYSGGGFTIMQQMLIDITGREFPDILRESVLLPIGMEYSTYNQPLPGSLLQFAAAGHRKSDTLVKEKRHIYPEMAAAGLWTTPSDLARFAIEIQLSMQGKSNKVLSKEMTEKMLVPVGSNYALGLAVSEKYFQHGGSNEGFKCSLKASMDKGYGIVIMTNCDSGSKLNNKVIEKIEEIYGWK